MYSTHTDVFFFVLQRIGPNGESYEERIEHEEVRARMYIHAYMYVESAYIHTWESCEERIEHEEVRACMYIYIYIYIYIHAYIYIRHAHIHTCICVYRRCIYTYMRRAVR